MIRLYIFGLLFFLGLGYAASSLAPRMPTRSKDLAQIYDIAHLSGGELFLELGCGTSHVSRYIATHNPTAKVKGIELARPLYIYSRIVTKMSTLSNLDIIYGNALQQDRSEVDVIYVFGMPRTVNGQIQTKAQSELKPGARIISYVFEMKDRSRGVVTSYPSEHNEGKIYVYEKC